MISKYYAKAYAFSAQHVMLVHTAHFAAGFGLAILLQHYLKGNSFVPVIVGWALVIFAIVVHVMAFMY